MFPLLNNAYHRVTEFFASPFSQTVFHSASNKLCEECRSLLDDIQARMTSSIWQQHAVDLNAINDAFVFLKTQIDQVYASNPSANPEALYALQEKLAQLKEQFSSVDIGDHQKASEAVARLSSIERNPGKESIQAAVALLSETPSTVNNLCQFTHHGMPLLKNNVGAKETDLGNERIMVNWSSLVYFSNKDHLTFNPITKRMNWNFSYASIAHTKKVAPTGTEKIEKDGGFSTEVTLTPNIDGLAPTNSADSLQDLSTIATSQDEGRISEAPESHIEDEDGFEVITEKDDEEHEPARRARDVKYADTLLAQILSRARVSEDASKALDQDEGYYSEGHESGAECCDDFEILAIEKNDRLSTEVTLTPNIDGLAPTNSADSLQDLSTIATSQDEGRISEAPESHIEDEDGFEVITEKDDEEHEPARRARDVKYADTLLVQILSRSRVSEDASKALDQDEGYYSEGHESGAECCDDFEILANETLHNAAVLPVSNQVTVKTSSQANDSPSLQALTPPALNIPAEQTQAKHQIEPPISPTAPFNPPLFLPIRPFGTSSKTQDKLNTPRLTETKTTYTAMSPMASVKGLGELVLQTTKECAQKLATRLGKNESRKNPAFSVFYDKLKQVHQTCVSEIECQKNEVHDLVAAALLQKVEPQIKKLLNHPAWPQDTDKTTEEFYYQLKALFQKIDTHLTSFILRDLQVATTLLDDIANFMDKHSLSELHSNLKRCGLLKDNSSCSNIEYQAGDLLAGANFEKLPSTYKSTQTGQYLNLTIAEAYKQN